MAVEYIKREDALCFEMEIEADPEEIQAITKGMALYGEYIKSIPAAEVTPRRKSRWVKKGYGKPRCFLCRAEMMCNHGGKYKPSKYCPNCGAEMEEEHAKHLWIPVTKRLPEIKEHYVSDTVLVYLDDGGMSFSKLEENIFSQAWFDIERTSPDGESDYTVTHWMPLPQPPESEGDTDNDDRCYECTGYGDDYYIDEDGELVSACSDCPFNEPPESDGE